jgi:hypothetical protein
MPLNSVTIAISDGWISFPFGQENTGRSRLLAGLRLTFSSISQCCVLSVSKAGYCCSRKVVASVSISLSLSSVTISLIDLLTLKQNPVNWTTMLESDNQVDPTILSRISPPLLLMTDHIGHVLFRVRSTYPLQ